MGMDFGDALLTAGHAAEALQHYRDALDDLEGQLTVTTADLHTRISLAHALSADPRSAQRALFDAVRAHQEVDEPMPGLRIAEVCEPLITTPQVYWTVDEVWAEVERSAASDASSPLALSDAMSSARRSLVRTLDRLFGLADGPTAPEGSVRPIVLELGSGLIPEDTSDRWVLFSDYIP